MKGIILAGGTGSRLYPLTKVTNKHLLPVGHEPMIYHSIQKLVKAGIDEILIVTGLEHIGAVISLLGSGKDFNCRFTYKVQDEAGGIAQALLLAENFVGGSLMTVILGDNIFQDDLSKFVNDFILETSFKTRVGAKILLKEVKDPQRFGVAEVTENRIVNIIEKPKEPKSNFAVTGIYMYSPDVFEKIKKLKPSDRGEYEITDVNNLYLESELLSYGVLQGWWTDAGTFESLNLANNLVMESK
jgi:glucose-1-phosphate thymidylyltransferase